MARLGVYQSKYCDNGECQVKLSQEIEVLSSSTLSLSHSIHFWFLYISVFIETVFGECASMYTCVCMLSNNMIL